MIKISTNTDIIVLEFIKISAWWGFMDEGIFFSLPTLF